MIAYIKGNVISVSKGTAVIETHGIGYSVGIGKKIAAELVVGEEISMHTHMYIKESVLQLYGFFSRDELSMFELLNTVSGVGPKAALNILDTLPPQDIANAVISEDAAALAKSPNVGKKTAEIIILKLRDKMAEFLGVHIQTPDEQPSKSEAANALIALGYSKTDALKAVLQVAAPDMNTEQIIRLALRKL
ncbi:Holliday junction ATP-dependent DNA helicase RuvA [Clostridia bacterium]|nr:Holliday junction ATP-dependent DNA helicase RuvA [Clostridia bacterium]